MNRLEKLKDLRSKIKEIEKKESVKKAKYILTGSVIALILFVGTVPTEIASLKRKISHDENLDLLNRYNEYIMKYSKNFNLKQLDDLDVFIKVISDYWDGIYYKDIDEIPFGYERLFLYEYKYGDCANIADDLTAKLNQINENYHARNLYVDMKDSNSKDEKLDKATKFWKETIVKANHCVTVVDIEDTILVIDPVNSTFGTIKNGKIIMFDETEKLEFAPFYTCNVRGMGELLSLGETILKSFKNKESMENLTKLYGKDAQGKSYEKI